VKMFDADENRMIGLPYGEKNYDDILSRFLLIPERYGQMDRQTDRQTHRFAISISRVSMLTRDKNQSVFWKHNTPAFISPDLSPLNAALDQLRVVESSTSNDPGPRSRQHQQIGQCLCNITPGKVEKFYATNQVKISKRYRK